MSVRASRERASEYGPHVLGKRVLILTMSLVLILSSGQFYIPVLAQQKEPSPITIELVAPGQAGPGSVIEVLVNYDAVDLNAGADINYNVFGPARVLTRDPEPPNPAYNTWIPRRETAQGTIKIRLQVNDGTEGQTVKHQVEVRWGTKVANWNAQTLVKLLPPTPTATPRPRPQPAAPTATPTATVPPELDAAIELHEVFFLDQDGQPLSNAETNQEIALQAVYASANDAQTVTVEIWFEPDVVNLDLPREGVRYVYALSALPAAPERASLFDPALKGRIRPYEEGGGGYPFRAIVRIVGPAGPAGDQVRELASAPLDITQIPSLKLSVATETEVVRAGESLIVHAVVENPGTVPASQVRLTLSDLPGGFSVSPNEQTIDQIAANGGTGDRVFTVRSASEFDGQIDFYATAATGGAVVASEPVQIKVRSAKPLALAVSTSATAMYAGDALYVDVSATNESGFEASSVSAKLIDVLGNLGVLVQDVGDIGPGDSREWVFVVQVPEDFPADTTATLVVQTMSEDGITSQSSEIEISVACRPRLEVFIEPPAGRLQGGDSAETIALVKNASQCLARGVSVSLAGLPASFAQPPAQDIPELAPGDVRYITFNILIPREHRGEMAVLGQAITQQGAKAQSPPVRIAIGGPSPWLPIVFGLLVLVVAITGVVGMVLYLRNR
jgi:hypothetical protein